MCAPLLVAALSVPMLKEKVVSGQWFAIAVGLSGVLLMLGPVDGKWLSTGSLWAIVALWTYALAVVSLRLLSRTDSTESMVLGFTLLLMIGAGLLAIPGWQTIDWGRDLALILGVGIMGSIGQNLITVAFRSAPAAVVAPFEYTAMLWGVLLDIAIWSVYPSALTLVGASIVIGAGLYLIQRERRQAAVRRREASAPHLVCWSCRRGVAEDAGVPGRSIRGLLPELGKADTRSGRRHRIDRLRYGAWASFRARPKTSHGAAASPYARPQQSCAMRRTALRIRRSRAAVIPLRRDPESSSPKQGAPGCRHLCRQCLPARRNNAGDQRNEQSAQDHHRVRGLRLRSGCRRSGSRQSRRRDEERCGPGHRAAVLALRRPQLSDACLLGRHPPAHVDLGRCRHDEPGGTGRCVPVCTRRGSHQHRRAARQARATARLPRDRGPRGNVRAHAAVAQRRPRGARHRRPAGNGTRR